VFEVLAKVCNPKILFIETEIEGDGVGYSLSPTEEGDRAFGNLYTT
jgi:hypothetical protein